MNSEFLNWDSLDRNINIHKGVIDRFKGEDLIIIEYQNMYYINKKYSIYGCFDIGYIADALLNSAGILKKIKIVYSESGIYDFKSLFIKCKDQLTNYQIGVLTSMGYL